MPWRDQIERRQSERWPSSRQIRWKVRRGRRARCSSIVERSLDGNVALLQSATQINTFDLQRVAIGSPEDILEDRFTAQDTRLRTIISISLIAAGALLVLVLYAFRRRIRPRFGIPGRRR